MHVPDVVMCTVSPPNRAGFCHFGAHHWVQRSYARRCPTVIAEVNPNLAQVYGDVYIHVSEIDHFVELKLPPFGRAEFEKAVATIADPVRQQGWRELGEELPDIHVLAAVAGVMAAVSPDDARRLLGMAEPPAEAVPMAQYLNEIIQDGDTIQIGTGEPSRGMARLGAFAGKKHLGIHTELGLAGARPHVARRHRRWHRGRRRTAARASPRRGPAATRMTSTSSMAIRTSSCTTRSTSCTPAR